MASTDTLWFGVLVIGIVGNCFEDIRLGGRAEGAGGQGSGKEVQINQRDGSLEMPHLHSW